MKLIAETNHTLGKDLVKPFVESRSGASPAKRGDEFVTRLAPPRLPSGRRAPAAPRSR